MGRPRVDGARSQVTLDVRTLWIGLASFALVLGCALTALFLLVRRGPDHSLASTEDAVRTPRETARAGDPPPLRRAQPPEPSATPPIPRIPTGRFVYAPESLLDAQFEAFRPLLEDGRLARTIDAVNVYALAHDIPIKTSQRARCVPGFDAGANAITLCLAEIADVHDRARSAMGIDAPLDDVQAMDRAADALTVRALSAMGHAIASDLRLPNASRPDEAGDDFAMLVLVQNGRGSTLLDGMAALGGRPASGVSRARVERVSCLAVGGDPTLRTSGTITDPATCASDYRRVDDAWTRTLEPFTREAITRSPRR